MKKDEFLVPNELGWECNDEISAYMDVWILRTSAVVMNDDESTINKGMWSVCKAELMDHIYGVIKKYQEEL